MTDRKTSLEGSQPPSRHRSPSTNQYYYDSLNQSPSVQPTGASDTRHRPSRTSSDAKVSPRSISPSHADSNKGTGKKSKPGRNTLKKPPRRDSLFIDTTTTSQGGDEKLDEEATPAGFVPKLSQVQEGKPSLSSRSRGSSTVSSTIEPRTRRRRHSEDNALSRTRVRHKHGSFQRQAESLGKLSNPSLISVLSGITQLSSASSGGTNSTVTQKSYGDLSHIAERKHPQARQKSKMARASNTPTLTKMDAAQPEVFKYLHQTPKVEHFENESVDDMPPSTIASSSSASSGDTQDDEDLSSNAEELQHTTDSPMTSPASTRTSNPLGSQPHGRGFRNPKTPLHASSFVHGHGDEHEDEEDDEDEEDEEDEEEEEDSEADGEEKLEEGNADAADTGHTPGNALEKAPPPRVPSTSSRHSDPHTRRLRQRERELANHILQSPQPHKDFQFAAGPPANSYPPMPLYSPRAYSGASPTNSNATADHVSGWPTMPPLQAPLPIGYSTHRSPDTGHPLPLTVWPPMGAPESTVQQIAPPFQHHPAQPPNYQPRAPAADRSKTTMVGYELLADKLSEPSKGWSNRSQAKSFVPMYRKFEHLNHRVLLHLQDEVCELEEELRYLDESIAQTSPRDETGHSYPASRRGDARYGGELHYRRTELLGRIFQKLGQYNQALSSFNNLLRDLDSSNAEDVRAYRTWMGKRLPIDPTEARFLDHETDLLAVSRKTILSTGRGAGHHHSAAVWFPLTLVLPLMTFAIVPGLLGRLIVILLIGGAELKLVTSTPELKSFMTIQEWTAAASAFIFELNWCSWGYDTVHWPHVH